MQRNATVSSEEETDLEMNKGVEFLLRTPPQPAYIISGWRKKMEQAIIALSVMVGILTLGFGAILGYLIRAYLQDTTPQYSHPEMYDENGNPLPDELIAIRFEGNPTQNDDED